MTLSNSAESPAIPALSLGKSTATVIAFYNLFGKVPMVEFAKLYSAEGKQVLYYIEPGDEDDEYVLHQASDIGGAVIDVKLRGPERVVRKVFDGINEASASRYFELDVVRMALSAFEEPA